MKEEYNQLIALFGSLDKDEQDAVLKDLKKIAEDGKEPQSIPELYIMPMERLLGCSLIEKDRSRIKVYAREIVAYTMACHGYSEKDIGKRLKKDHSTIHHYKDVVHDALQLPNANRELVTLYETYRKLIEK